ncbi:MAG: hypothetical protein N3D84_02520 [Candidatus Woesearchaeota archaeon]|nr:hypothetical protein [Candidatus Woesearchaeota archaeon]
MAIKILSETPIAMADLKKGLARIKERDKELNFRSQRTEEYLNMFVEISAEQAKEIMSKIESLNISRLKPEHMIKLIDLMPKSVEEAKSIMSAYPITISNENLKKIVDILAEYQKKQ